MEFETVERCGRIHVIVNGVESAGFIERDCGGNWGCWDFVLVAAGPADEGLAHIADAMDTWYTTDQAAARLVELGAYDTAPSAREICGWARNDLLPGAVRVKGKGCAGRGGPWRIPESALAALVERRKR